MTLSPKDYCLIPGNFAIKFVETQKSPIVNHFQFWFWLDTLQVHRLASNKIDISPDIDPTEISDFKSTTLTNQASYYLDHKVIMVSSLRSWRLY